MKIKVNGINLDYTDDGKGLPVLFLHAFPLNKTMWDEQVAHLKNDYRVITLDHRGFDSSEVVAEPTLMSQMAADARELLRALMIEQAVLVGLSMGGYATLAFYRDYPEMVRALVLADSRASADTDQARANRLLAAEKAEREGAAAIAEDMLPKLLGKTSLAAKPELIERLRRIQVANSPTGIAAAQRGMAARQDSTELLARITVPTLVIVGAEDTLTPPAESEALHKGISGSQFRIIEGAGHLANVEQPDAFNNALREFLNAL